METGLYYARIWAAEHGSLDLPRTAQHGGFPLGRWLAQQRHQANLHRDLFDTPWPHEEHLVRIDPYWNPPWGMKWQRRYQAARTQLTPGRSLATTADLDALPSATAKWLFTQCSSYDSLHPEQQQLLAEIGLTSKRARALAPPQKPPQPARPTRPRLKNPPSAFAAGLPYAQAWTAQHGNLTSADYRTEHDCFPLGWWLYKQRRAAHAHVKRTGRPWPPRPATRRPRHVVEPGPARHLEPQLAPSPHVLQHRHALPQPDHQMDPHPATNLDSAPPPPTNPDGRPRHLRARTPMPLQQPPSEPDRPANRTDQHPRDQPRAETPQFTGRPSRGP
ncbi:Helicase associated domain protein [Streptomyces sp. NPDC050287]|uniref:helicase associated domain-containing protein n=1 Tax=Streptomyces sp. NPDC050287 TaxID=3365608 RepID=UPI0037878982